MLNTRDDAILDDSDDEYWLEQRRNRLRATHAGRQELRAGLTRCLREKGWKERLVAEEKARVVLRSKGGVRAAAAWPATASRSAAAAAAAAATADAAKPAPAATPTPMRCPPAAMRFPHHAAGSPLQFGDGPASAGGHGTPWSEDAGLEATPYYADAKPHTPLCADVFVSPPPPPHASAASPAMVMPAAAAAGGVAATAACGAAGDAGAWHDAAGAGCWGQAEAEEDGGCRHALELESPRFADNGSPEEGGGAEYAEYGLQDATLAGIPGSCDTSYSHQIQRERESGFVSAYARGGAVVEEVEADESGSAAAAAPAAPACRDSTSRFDLASFQKLKEEIHMNQSLLSQNASAHVPFP